MLWKFGSYPMRYALQVPVLCIPSLPYSPLRYRKVRMICTTVDTVQLAVTPCKVITYSKRNKDQPGKVANPARGQLNRENEYLFVPVARLSIWSRETGSAVSSRVSLLISTLRLNVMLTNGILPDFRGGVHLFIVVKHATFYVEPRSIH